MHAHRGISRRHMLEIAAGGLVMAGSVRSAWTQTKRIETLDPALDAIIDKSQTIQELASGYGGDLGPAEGTLWWKEGGYLLFRGTDLKRWKYAPGQPLSVFKENTNAANGITRWPTSTCPWSDTTTTAVPEGTASSTSATSRSAARSSAS